jgi:hypothetical protein
LTLSPPIFSIFAAVEMAHVDVALRGLAIRMSSTWPI